MNPVSAQQAALRLLLEDVDPLLARAEAITQTLHQVHEQLERDLGTMTDLVERALALQPALLEAGRKLSASAARIEATLPDGVPVSLGANEAAPRPRRWRALALGAVLSATLTLALVHVATRERTEQARLGRALQSAWASLEPAVQQKVRAAMRREQ